MEEEEGGSGKLKTSPMLEKTSGVLGLCRFASVFENDVYLFGYLLRHS